MGARQKISFLIFVGHPAESPVEQMLALANQAVALDTIEKALSLDDCERVIVATGSTDFVNQIGSLPVVVELDDEEFHYGKRLHQLIHKHKIEHPFYIGGGSAPLLPAEEISRICQALLSEQNVVISNNFYSSDFVAFTPGVAIDKITLPDTDNNLAFPLHYQAGLSNKPLPRSAATQMDVDTPTDIMILQLHPATGYHTRKFLQEINLDLSNLKAVLSVMNNRDAQLVVAGRLGAPAWSLIEARAACQTRIFAEERGMRASGRDAAGKVRSLLGFYIESQGMAKFFKMLAQIGDAALIDSRVIFQHLGLRLTASDRYNSDLLRAEEVQDPVAREFTAAARDAPIPIVLGGHSLVAGGLWALVDTAIAARTRVNQ